MDDLLAQLKKIESDLLAVLESIRSLLENVTTALQGQKDAPVESPVLVAVHDNGESPVDDPESGTDIGPLEPAETEPTAVDEPEVKGAVGEVDYSAGEETPPRDNTEPENPTVASDPEPGDGTSEAPSATLH